MELFYTLFYINSALLAAIIIFKTYLFISGSHHQYVNWLHFSKHNIYNSGNNKVAKAKQIQNTLSTILLIFTILDLSLLFMADIA